MLAVRGQILDNKAENGRQDSEAGRRNRSAHQVPEIEDYYKILDISPSASTAEIKRAFRKKAKELHPDIPHNVRNIGGKRANEQALMRLIRAYEALLDVKRRAEFDFFYNKTVKKGESFDYRTWLKEQADPESRATLIFFDLFHNAEDEARNILRFRFAVTLAEETLWIAVLCLQKNSISAITIMNLFCCLNKLSEKNGKMPISAIFFRKCLS